MKVEKQRENESKERLGIQQIGEDWIRAITDGAVEQLAQFCHPGVVSHLQTPRRYITYDQAVDLIAKFQQWFGACSNFTVEHSRVAMVGERLGIFYRLRLLEDGAWSTVEQQLYCDIEEGTIVRLHLVCSGFQPVEQPATSPDLLLELYSGASDRGSTCALLTPAIKGKLREMQSGQVLEVRVDDYTARGDIEAWSRLSGNRLLQMSEAGTMLRFLIQKK